MEDYLLSCEEVCARWKGAIKPITLDKWRREGKIAAIKMGRTYLYKLADVIKYENENKVGE